MRTQEAAAALAGDEVATFVAPLLPPTAPTPERPRRIGFIRALFLFWLLPKRYGPHLAAGSFRRAFAGHVVAVFLAAVICAPVMMDSAEGWGLDEVRGLHDLRMAVATFLLYSAAASGGTGWSWFSALTILGTVPLLELAIVLLGTAMMPFAAGGDSAWSVWKRSVKNAYWATTIVIPVSAYGTTVYFISEGYDGYSQPESVEFTAVIVMLLILAAFAFLLVRLLIVGAHEYVGDAHGPAFSPREPHCDECGYLIIGLPYEARCPECGLSVRESLPGGRRGGTDWHERRFSARWFKTLVRMQGTVLRGVEPFRQIPVHAGIGMARGFWWGTWLLVSVAQLALLRLAMPCISAWAELKDGATVGGVAPITYMSMPGIFEAAMGPIALACLAAPLVFQAGMTFAACIWAQWRYGVRDYRVSAITCYYASPLIWPVMLVSLAGAVFAMPPVGPWLEYSYSWTLWGATSVDGWEVVVLALLITLPATLLFWWLRLLKALRAVRFANV